MDVIRKLLVITLAGCMMMGFTAAAQADVPSYSTEQARQGEDSFNKYCVSCHGANLTDGSFGPPLAGKPFQGRWAGRSMEELFGYLRAAMPPGLTGQISNSGYISLMAYLLEKNGIKATGVAMPLKLEALSAMLMPGKPVSDQERRRGFSPGGPLSPGIKLPDWPQAPSALANITPVTPAMIANPPPGDWLTWRRSYHDLGFSPLRQINRNNVKNLRLAWSLSLPAGPNAATPLVHDGVIFVHSFGDHVQALNAASGDELWHYGRLLGENTRPGIKRNLALYGDKVYVPTSDNHEVALDMKTGRVIWDQPVTDGNPRWSLTGGPLVADGVVMQGIQGQAPGGAYVIGLDAETGKELWRFHTIPRPGEPGGNSWNGLKVEQRSGGSVWNSGSYDPVLNLAYFGPTPTYDTGPMRDPVHKAGISNDALFTDSTIALNPRTGKLSWYYQHLANDQWDMDWGFERQILDLKVNGSVKKVVFTMGKEAVGDILEADTGKYIASFDLGLQNIITHIDPNTGKKTIDPALIPYGDKPITICPHGGGAKNWIPGSINPGTQVLYMPLVESCAVLLPLEKGQLGLSSGVRFTIRPRPDSDGRYGRIQAIDLNTRKTLWIRRQRAPLTAGVVATAGGVLFTGGLDRTFAAYDQQTGKVLWHTGLTDVPSAAPISYEVNGRQYIAVVVGYGTAWSVTFAALVPEINLPVTSSSAIFVFALPD